MDGLGLDDVKELVVLLPPRPEQRAIAAFLDWETARIGALIEGVHADSAMSPMSLLGRHVTLLQEYRAALISAAVAGQIDVRGEV
jgi:type I restriction enzyme S subunit